MKKKELLNKIKDSAENVVVPESIRPDKIKEKLSETEKIENASFMEDVSEPVSGRKKFIYIKRITAAAAAFVILLAGVVVAKANMASRGCVTEDRNYVASTGKDNVNEKDKKEVRKQSIGEEYVIAESYDNVYKTLKKHSKRYSSMDGTAELYGIEESLGATEELMDSKAVFDTAEKENTVQKSNGDDFSSTNVQTEGIDEGDIVKTDGKYIYQTTQNGFYITNIQSDNMKVVANVNIDSSKENSLNKIKEMYIYGDRLSLVVETEKAGISSDGDDVYRMDTDMTTSLKTYDITDRESPELIGEVTQDGFYYTSRKKGDIIYLFTNEYMDVQGVGRGHMEDEIPLVNGKKVLPEDIYLSEEGSDALIISSVNTARPKDVTDELMILNNASIYMGNEYLYLYEEDYTTGNTVISKFTMEDGVIKGDVCNVIEGSITDTFAINEYRGRLRVATLKWDNDIENQVFVLDENLTVVGSIKGLAKGEEIKSARFMGDTLYLVTYENTDPLFVIDLSDERNPEVKSSLEITGFSEYLHKWSDDFLLGLGVETDENTGRWEGLKLSLFDVKDMSNVNVSDTFLWKNDSSYNDAPGLYSYKCILADVNANLFGFACQSYDEGYYKYKIKYELFTVQDGKLRQLLDTEIDKHITSGITEDEYNSIRGVYVGNRFYVVSYKGIQSFDRENNYEKVNELLF